MTIIDGHTADEEAVLAQARARYGPNFKPAEVLRDYHEAQAIGRARAEYGRTMDRALNAYNHTLSGAQIQLERDRRRAYDETMQLCEPARQLCMAELHKLAQMLNEQPDLTTDAYDTLVVLARQDYDRAVAPLMRTHDTLIAEAYREHDATVERAKAAYDGLMAGARARYDEAVAEATRDAHQRGQHQQCDPLRCAVAAAQTI